MDPTLEAILRSWRLDPWVIVPLVLTALFYLRGWWQLRRRAPRRFGPWQLAAFLGGLTAIFLALASPIEPFATLLLQVHMIQHLLLMMVAPPLFWLGAPALPLLRGLPLAVRRTWVGPVLRLEGVRLGFRFLTRPVTAWLLFVAATWFWHIPRFYDLALTADRWHYLEHACFLITALLFWWPVVRPYPARPPWSPWLLVPYLLLADVQNTALAALLAFSPRLLYPHYATVPRLGGLSALDDQATAGVIMWVPGSIAFLVPLGWIGCRLLFGAEEERQGDKETRSGRIALPLAGPPKATASSRLDLLHLPLLGRFLKWRYARTALQVPVFLVALIIILDGLLGPDVAAMNLAGVLPWIHWRGLIVLGLLLAGNVFCMACPFLLPRTLARRWLPARRNWPRWLRAKWLALGLLVLFFWAYETFALWASPWWTAWIALGYFAAAFAIDGWFRGAAFCKYVCPIGQFHFVQSLVSPLQVSVRDTTVCAHCTTRDCIRGNDKARGCELHLFQPRKAGNMDCTFCLDCVHACPHDNVGITAAMPGSDLLRDPHRSGVGRFGRRLDLAALVVVLVFAGFVNAAGMVAPVVEWEDQLTRSLALSHRGPVVTVGLLGALLVLPLVLVGSAAVLGRWWSGDTGRLREVACRFAYALVPLGLGMWLAHYCFHFLTSAGTAIPVTQRLAADLGMTWLGEPEWSWCCCGPVAPWLLRLEILFLDVGLLLSLYSAYRIAHERCPQPGRAWRALAPWAMLLVLLFVVGIWLLFQPMEMRGTLM